MRLLWILLLISANVFSQEEITRNYRITLGSSLQYELYHYKEYIANGSTSGGKYIQARNSGFTLDLRLNFQNRFFIFGLNTGINTSPIDGYMLIGHPNINASFNINYKKDKTLSKFIGPFIKYGYLIPNESNIQSILKYNAAFSTGFLFSSKFFQLELGTFFRKKNNTYTLPVFQNCFYTSIGFRIPLKREQKN